MKHFYTLFLFFSIFSVFSCKNDVDLFSDEHSNNKISIEITGDENIIIKTETIEVKKGSRWKGIKRKALKCVQYEKGYVFDSSFLDEEELTGDYIFNQNSTIYITSKIKNETSEKKVKLTLRGDEHIEIDDEEVEVKLNSTWKEIKDEMNSRLQIEKGYELSKWKIGKSKNANTLKDNHVFRRNCTIYAISKEVEENTIILNLIGDENIILEYTTLEVIAGSRWLEIKDSQYISSTKAKNGYHLSEWKIENSINSKSISNDYAFNSYTTLYIFAIKGEENSSDLQNAPTNIEVDALGMVTINPPPEGIRGVEIDYSLCNYPKEPNEKLWHGVFREETITELSAYKIHQYETTYKLWKEVYDWAILKGYVFENAGRKGCDASGGKTSEDEPVTTISYRDCLVWCNAYTEKLNKNEASCVYLESKDGKVLKDAKEEKNGKNLCDCAYMDITKKGMRLPTEAEWEFAARLQTKTTTNATLYGSVYLTRLNSASGANLPICTPKLREAPEQMYNELVSTTVCNTFYNGSSFKCFVPEVNKTSRVGSKRANQAGLYDMSGNVAEWCSNIGLDEIFLNSSEDSIAIARGGAWASFSYVCSVGYRETRNTSMSIGTVGFRLCRSK